jgi:hypothetical protein
MSPESTESAPKTPANRPIRLELAAATSMSGQAVSWATYGRAVEFSGEWFAGVLAVVAAGHEWAKELPFW